MKLSEGQRLKHTKENKPSLGFHPVLSASGFFQEDESRRHTIKHICIGSYSRGCTFTICCCYGNPFSLQVSGEPLAQRRKDAVPLVSKRGRSPLSVHAQCEAGYFEKVCSSVEKCLWIIDKTIYSPVPVGSWGTPPFILIIFCFCLMCAHTTCLSFAAFLRFFLLKACFYWVFSCLNWRLKVTVVWCSDCQTFPGKFVTSGYINITDLTWQDIQMYDLFHWWLGRAWLLDNPCSSCWLCLCHGRQWRFEAWPATTGPLLTQVPQDSEQR